MQCLFLEWIPGQKKVEKDFRSCVGEIGMRTIRIADQVGSLRGDGGLVVLPKNVLVLRRHVLRSSGVKCHRVCYLLTSGSVK